jgi:UDP-glucuronate 4-epimerase
MAYYLVTGVAGFIGSRVAEMLLDDGHRVHGVDNLNDAYDIRMKDYRLQRLLDREGFSFDLLDISEWQAVDGWVARKISSSTFPHFSAIINLAARAGVRQSVDNPWVYVSTNMTGTLNLLEVCRRYAIPKLILASTSSIYGNNAPLPTPETAQSDYPLQAYAASKKGAEAMCHAYHFMYGIDVTIVRYFTVYGPAGRPDMSMFRFTKWISEGKPVIINGDGEQSRGFTFLDDIARGTIQAVNLPGYEIINLGGHEVIKINALIRLLEEKIGRKAEIVRAQANQYEMLANWANIEKAMRLLRWKPQVGINEGVTKVVEWYNSERSWVSLINTD